MEMDSTCSSHAHVRTAPPGAVIGMREVTCARAHARSRVWGRELNI
jgi:hypothetical protein